MPTGLPPMTSKDTFAHILLCVGAIETLTRRRIRDKAWHSELRAWAGDLISGLQRLRDLIGTPSTSL
jgi:hypothetical protein